VEHAITPAWSVKFEYDYLQFGNRDVTTPRSNVIDPLTGDVTDVVARVTSNVRQDAHVLKAGLNYKWGSDRRRVSKPRTILSRAIRSVLACSWRHPIGSIWRE
jgi:hypothetical protein